MHLREVQQYYLNCEHIFKNKTINTFFSFIIDKDLNKKKLV